VSTDGFWNALSEGTSLALRQNETTNCHFKTILSAVPSLLKKQVADRPSAPVSSVFLGQHTDKAGNVSKTLFEVGIFEKIYTHTPIVLGKNTPYWRTFVNHLYSVKINIHPVFYTPDKKDNRARKVSQVSFID